MTLVLNPIVFGMIILAFYWLVECFTASNENILWKRIHHISGILCIISSLQYAQDHPDPMLLVVCGVEFVTILDVIGYSKSQCLFRNIIFWISVLIGRGLIPAWQTYELYVYLFILNLEIFVCIHLLGCIFLGFYYLYYINSLRLHFFEQLETNKTRLN